MLEIKIFCTRFYHHAPEEMDITDNETDSDGIKHIVGSCKTCQSTVLLKIKDDGIEEMEIVG